METLIQFSDFFVVCREFLLNRNDFISISESDLILLRVQVIDEYNPEFINKTIFSDLRFLNIKTRHNLLPM